MTTASQNANGGGSGEWALMRWRFTPISAASTPPRQIKCTRLPHAKGVQPLQWGTVRFGPVFIGFAGCAVFAVQERKNGVNRE